MTMSGGSSPQTQRPRHVLHVTRVPITVTAFLMPLLRAHRLRGERVSVACGDGPEIGAIESEGVDVHRYRLGRNIYPWNLLLALLDLRGIIRRERVDWVFTHTPIASALARVASRWGGARGTLYMAHGLSCAPLASRASWTMGYTTERLLARFTDGLITMNRHDFDLARRWRLARSVERIFLVNGVGVDSARLERLARQIDPQAVRKEIGVPADVPMVLLLARTLAAKGVREFIEAARLLSLGESKACFVIGGSGPLDAEIRRFVRRHGLEGRVLPLGWRRDAPRLMAACDIYALPTYYPEGLPVSILEAMACAKPVVATLHRGCEDEVVDGETGLLVEPKDAPALARAIDALILDPEKARRFGEAGRRRVHDQFRVEHTTRQTMDAFDQVVRQVERTGPEPNAKD